MTNRRARISVSPTCHRLAIEMKRAVPVTSNLDADARRAAPPSCCGVRAVITWLDMIVDAAEIYPGVIRSATPNGARHRAPPGHAPRRRPAPLAGMAPVLSALPPRRAFSTTHHRGAVARAPRLLRPPSPPDPAPMTQRSGVRISANLALSVPLGLRAAPRLIITGLGPDNSGQRMQASVEIGRFGGADEAGLSCRRRSSR
jgi:hypothetical protein